MKEIKYIAHIRREEDGGVVIQDLFDHLRGVAERARGFADAFGAGGFAECMGLLHDVGKFAAGWQDAIRRENDLDGLEDEDAKGGKSHHSSLGAVVLPAKSGRWGPSEKVVAYAVAGHHAGLPDWVSGGKGASAEFRLTDGGESIAPKLAELLKDVKRDPTVARYLDDIEIPSPKDTVPRAENINMWIRMLFSCLVDADYLDTECFMDPSRAAMRVVPTSLADLKAKLDAYMSELAEASRGGAVNAIRANVLAKCREAALRAQGCFTLSVPTGAGKTLASMAFALDHAIAHGKKRVIVAAPYTSIIEQTAEVYARIFGDENVVQHHSSLDPERETLRSRLAAEDWSAPIIVTTNVRFFETLASARPASCRRMHNIVDSVVILDEAHLIPPGYLCSAELALAGLIESFGVTVLKCSATMPIISGRVGGGSAAFDAPNISTEIYGASRKEMFDALKRVHIHLPRDDARMEWDEVAERLSLHDRVLCIVDTRRSARELHALMPRETFHLSALMCAADRSDTIEEIKLALDGGGPVRVVSTQLIEAGVDIDFPVVYRAFAGIDSILQASGRCNREGRMESGDVFVFNAPNAPPPGLLAKGADIARSMLSGQSELEISDGSIRSYFEKLLNVVNDLDAPSSRGEMFKIDRRLEYRFRTYAQKYHLIDEGGQVPIIVPYINEEKDKDGAAMIEELDRKITRGLVRQLQRYTVNIHAGEFSRMRGEGMIREVGEGKFFALSMPEFYKNGLGVDVSADHIDGALIV